MEEVINENKTKQCSICKEFKSLNDFYKDKTRGDGYRSKCKFCISNYGKTFYIDNKAKKDACHKQYVMDNKCKIQEKRSIRSRFRYANDEEYRMRKNIRSRILDALKTNSKSSNTLSLIGLPSFEILAKWLRFNKSLNVTDEKPHIDHLIPCKSFNLSILEEQNKCFHWSNLRYMNAIDNIKKGHQYPDISEILVQDAMAHAFNELVLKA